MNLRSIANGARFAVGAAAGVAAAAWATERLIARNIRRAPDADANRALVTPIYVDRRLQTHDRGTIRVVEEGDGPPIVLSHGVLLSIRTWFHQLELLPKEGYRAIAYDHRGHGESVLGEAGHSLDNIADDLKTVVEGLDLRDAILVGHSMGGVAVQAFVIRHPDVVAERVRGIVLLSTLAKAPFGSRSTQMKSNMERFMGRVPDTAKLWEQRNLGLVMARVGFGRNAHPSHVELVRQMLLANSPENRRDAPRVLVGLDLTEELPKFTVPTLVIGGTADALTPPSYARELARLIPGARLELVEGGGHMLMLERVELINKLIVDFAASVGVKP